MNLSGIKFLTLSATWPCSDGRFSVTFGLPRVHMPCIRNSCRPFCSTRKPGASIIPETQASWRPSLPAAHPFGFRSRHGVTSCQLAFPGQALSDFFSDQGLAGDFLQPDLYDLIGCMSGPPVTAPGDNFRSDLLSIPNFRPPRLPPKPRLRYLADAGKKTVFFATPRPVSSLARA